MIIETFKLLCWHILLERITSIILSLFYLNMFTKWKHVYLFFRFENWDLLLIFFSSNVKISIREAVLNILKIRLFHGYLALC